MKRLSQAKFSRSACSRIRDSSSRYVMSSTQWQLFSIAPMAPDGSGESLHPHGQAADVVADLDRLLAVAKAQRGHDPDRLQPLPQREPRQALRGRKLKIRSRLLPPVALLRRHILMSLFQIAFELFVDVVDDRLMQRLLVPLQRQDIVAPRPR